MATWTPVQADLGRGTAGLLGVAQRGIGAIGDTAGQYLDRVAKEEAVAYQKERDKKADEQWAKSFSLQEQQADRAQKEFDRKVLGQNMMAHIDAATADVMNRGALTEKGQQKLLSEYDRLVKAGMDPRDAGSAIATMYETNQGGIRQVPMTTKAKIAAVEGINLGSGELQYDPSMALEQKDKLLANLRSQYENELDRQQQLDLTKMKIAADAAEGDKARAHDIRLASMEGTKEPMVKMFKERPDGTIHNIEVPLSQAGEYKSKAGFSIGTVGGTRRTDSSGGKPILGLRSGIGKWDDQRVNNLASLLQNAGLTDKKSIHYANMSVEDTAYGSGVNYGKILEPVYQELRKIHPSITKRQVAEYINTGF